ncbi:MAG: hypothetical protein J6V53_06535 [Alphaproteobacteria bacterium]|nr:hypothetical protein [Alphaproteobacteria bacterium]
MKQEINKDLCLSQEERKILKQEIAVAWDEMPLELKEFIVEAHQQNLKTLYMLQDWAKKNNHETMLELLSRKIAYKEEKIQKMESSLK